MPLCTCQIPDTTNGNTFTMCQNCEDFCDREVRGENPPEPKVGLFEGILVAWAKDGETIEDFRGTVQEAIRKVRECLHIGYAHAIVCSEYTGATIAEMHSPQV